MHNILVILTDQQRKDSLGCYGHPVCQTPNLDALAERGRQFERHYVANPICMPSRMSIFSGQYPSHHGLWTNGLLIDERPTLPGHLSAHGYQTASIGKIHFTPFGGEGGNYESRHYWANHPEAVSEHGPYWGFDHVELSLGHTRDEAHYGAWFYANGGDSAMRVPDEHGNRPMPEHLHDSAWVAERTVDYLQRRDRERPFFAVASFPDPHSPFDPPRSAFDRYDPAAMPAPTGGPGDLDTRPEHYRAHYHGAWDRSGVGETRLPDGIDQATARCRMAQTCAMVDLIDRNTGRILRCLEQEGLVDDTLVVFLSDHGELLGDHGLWAKGPFFYESLINTPLLIAGPGVEAGVSHSLFSDVDLAATLCDLAGAGTLPVHDDVSHAGHLRDTTTPGARDACLIEYQTGYGEADIASRVLLTRRYKYVRYETGEEELTDLQADPDETRNVAGDATYAEALSAMRLAMLDALVKAKPRTGVQVAHA